MGEKTDESLMQRLHAESEIRRRLIDYATIVDTRAWPKLDDVFVPTATAIYGSDPAFQFTCEDLDKIRQMCQSNLDGCGPTQHLITNFQIDVNLQTETASSVCSVQAGHFGRDQYSQSRYEMWGEYRDRWLLTTTGWRIIQRQLHVVHEFGDREHVLGSQ